ncbi:iron dependent repressor, metal binding and dimerization domain protein [Corynebacterium sp. P3-F1]|uniref:metal-dependent transcriptional regulator n=1 Tax=Corynebacterium sp. P3-F1 TaxID=3059080 RepID=UPI00265CBEE6|nr:metal-dependent transcriptional regulator [Corynebacterium sp. P3-F1]WKK61684.1 iron dependent repressor, metal binding and dimerization domain protein [Corynebacterium sp. P3-F1]
MRDLVDTTEMYLRTVYELEEEGIIPLRARIAERLDQSGPTVSQTVARMERDGLIVVESDRSLSLTERGRELATSVMRKHRLAERLLTDVLNLEVSQVHAEACRWEHVMSEEVERRMLKVLDDPTRSPFGNPIPALDELGYTEPTEKDLGTRASDLTLTEPTRVEVVQINEILQLDSEHYSSICRFGIERGAEVTLERTDNGSISVVTDSGSRVYLAPELAHALRVSPLET